MERNNFHVRPRDRVLGPMTSGRQGASPAADAPLGEPLENAAPESGLPDGAGGSPGIVHRTLASLGHRHFRYLWLGSMLGMGGFQMQGIARILLVDDLTGSAFITSVVAMGFAPTMLIMSLFGGVAGDRLERRRVIQVSQAASGLLALIVGILIFTDAVHWVHLLIASLIQGVTFAFQMPARQAILPKLVGKDNVTNAVSLNSAGMGLMTIVAPGIAGVLYGSSGPDVVYFTVAAMSVLAVLLTGQIPRMPPEKSSVRRNVFADIGMGLRYVRGNRVVLMLLGTGLVSAVLAMPFRMQIPIVARRLYDIEASDIGWLMAMMGVGAVVATLVTANFKRGHHRGSVMVLVGIVGSGVTMLLLALLPTYEIGFAIMLLVGIAGSIRMTLGQSLMIEATDSEYRARVMSLFMMTFGLMPLGALPMGFMIDEFGAETTLFVIGGVLTGIGLLFYTVASSLRRFS